MIFIIEINLLFLQIINYKNSRLEYAFQQQK